jgi:hypothetical protein
VSDDQQHERATAEDDAKEDLELTDEDAEQVAGGLSQKWAPVTDSPDFHFDK